jgi:hypothetical protein
MANAARGAEPLRRRCRQDYPSAIWDKFSKAIRICIRASRAHSGDSCHTLEPAVEGSLMAFEGLRACLATPFLTSEIYQRSDDPSSFSQRE